MKMMAGVEFHSFLNNRLNKTADLTPASVETSWSPVWPIGGQLSCQILDKKRITIFNQPTTLLIYYFKFDVRHFAYTRYQI